MTAPVEACFLPCPLPLRQKLPLKRRISRESILSCGLLIPAFAIFSTIFAMLSSCADQAIPEPVEKAKEEYIPPELLGRIASIPEKGKFVLVQAYSSWKTPAGSILTTRGTNNRRANLRVTGEKLGQFAAADIQSGTLEVGDAVYSIAQLPDLAQASATTSFTSENEEPNVTEGEAIATEPVTATSSDQIKDLRPESSTLPRLPE